MHHKKPDKKRFLKVLAAKSHHIGKACDAFDISRQTFYEWMKEQWFAEEVDAMQEKDIDDSEDTMRILRKGIPKLNEEGKIVGWLLQPDTVANIFFLKTKGKKRGYVERQEFDFNPSEVINVTVSPSVIGHRKDILEP